MIDWLGNYGATCADAASTRPTSLRHEFGPWFVNTTPTVSVQVVFSVWHPLQEDGSVPSV